MKKKDINRTEAYRLSLDARLLDRFLFPLSLSLPPHQWRPQMPIRPIPSQKWCDNFGDKKPASN